MSDMFELLGAPSERSVLVIVDHASNHVPDDIELGIPIKSYTDHIAYDIGVAEVARYMMEHTGFMTVLAKHSRLVADLNRYPEDAGVIPLSSDGIDIPGNVLSREQRTERINRYFHPYHDQLGALIDELWPRLIISLHSFTPHLRTSSEARPWHVGVLYNNYQLASRRAIDFLKEQELVVGDQLPYSGKDLNATMNRQAEKRYIAYTGIEIRQDMISHEFGQRRFANILYRMCTKILSSLAQ